MEDEALERFQDELVENDKAKAEEINRKRARTDFEFFKQHLEAAREYLIAHKLKVQTVRAEIEAAKSRVTGPGK